MKRAKHDSSYTSLYDNAQRPFFFFSPIIADRLDTSTGITAFLAQTTVMSFTPLLISHLSVSSHITSTVYCSHCSSSLGVCVCVCVFMYGLVPSFDKHHWGEPSRAHEETHRLITSTIDSSKVYLLLCTLYSHATLWSFFLQFAIAN